MRAGWPGVATSGLIGSGLIGSTLARLAVPFKAYHPLPREPLAGKTVIDAGNYAAQRDGRVEALDNGSATSSELLQHHLGESAHVVRAFNNIHHTHLALLNRPTGAEDRSALPIAGDDAEAKRHATELLDTLGHDTDDAGPLAQNRLFAPGTPAYGAPHTELPSGSLTSLAAGPASAELLSPTPGPAPAAEIRALPAKASIARHRP